MGRALVSASVTSAAWAKAGLVSARDRQRDFLRFAGRHPMAADPERPAAQEHGVRLFLPMARHRAIHKDQPLPRYDGPCAGRARGLTERRSPG